MWIILAFIIAAIIVGAIIDKKKTNSEENIENDGKTNDDTSITPPQCSSDPVQNHNSVSASVQQNPATPYTQQPPQAIPAAHPSKSAYPAVLPAMGELGGMRANNVVAPLAVNDTPMTTPKCSSDPVQNKISISTPVKQFPAAPYTQQPHKAIPAAHHQKSAHPAAPPAMGKFGGMWANNVVAPQAIDKNLTTGSKVYAPSGNPVVIGSQHEIASGGEGIVYECPEYKNFLIKIYKPATRQDKAKMNVIHERIKAMCEIKPLHACKSFAWPISPVYADAHQQEFIGFVMRKCSGKSLASLRSASQVQTIFPHWDRKSLAKAALDFVKKVRVLANHNILINDFNPSNFLLDKDCHVYFIDCDSYQITDQRGKTHTTGTYFASHVAPELLINKNALLQPRDIHHVQFGAALIIFNILMYGLHPYSYHDPDHKSACADPETNLRKGRCPLGIGSGCLLPVGNWYNLWSWLIHDLKSSLIATFQEGHSEPTKRAGLNNLISVLEKQILTMDMNPDYCKLVPPQKKSRDWKGNPNRSSNSFAKNQTFF